MEYTGGGVMSEICGQFSARSILVVQFLGNFLLKIHQKLKALLNE